MIFYIFLSVIVLLIFSIFLLKKKKILSIFLDSDFAKKQSFHKVPILRLGGFLIFISLFISFFYFTKIHEVYNVFYSIIFLNFFLGLLDDAKIIKNPFIKFIIFLIFNSIFIYVYNIKIDKFDIFFLDYLNQSNIFTSLIISLAAIFFVTNGSNLIDGFNGLLTIHMILISFFIFAILKIANITLFADFVIYNLIILLAFLPLNFPKAKFFLGDCGSLLLGSVIAYKIIFISNIKSDVSPFFFAILIYYIFFEIFFSVFRKIIEKKSPFLPDNKHLHMLVYFFIKKRSKLDIEKCNYLTSISVNTYYFLSALPSLYIYNNNFFCKIYFFILIFNYIIIYLILNKTINNKIEKN